MADRPHIIPLFPLPNFVLFPGVRVPLHIFEPRYREMVADVAETHGIIGMMLLKGPWERDYHGFPDVFTVGCAGHIEELIRLPDGRFNLILSGIGEFEIEQEFRERSFRQGRVRWMSSAEPEVALSETAMGTLRELLVGFLGEPANDVWHSLVDQRGLRGLELVNYICFHLDVSPIEKQTLLEALNNRPNTLIDVLTFKLEERKLGPGGGSSDGTSGPLQ
ncbi:MAG TPA: LON peptidase substrate-binding domain-containing protein [Candidatus Binataceae bacterium]|nr:LON peptidase substrate-binding domain-containing protein [Candidatus Binataceae bacterium]